MTDLPVTEGEIFFNAPGAGKPCKTWYKIVGNLQSSSVPLIALHGGPGAGHNYLLSLTDLYRDHGIPVIFYDQIGCGRSTHFQEKMGDTSFWTFDLYLAELDNLIDHLNVREKGFYLLGQSWGGVLTGIYASLRPKGLQKGYYF
ncbi:Alpha/Beta hydrolase protein [Podospora australis]|uniref:Alpha/Beta hydrolase protein n=1 Tax=Podospora australis TaxID=1536484 RepID=A0AAN7ACE0_9PEZI|nr:Alpha/Beta hydrolase protein [Podospora australis]